MFNGINLLNHKPRSKQGSIVKAHSTGCSMMLQSIMFKVYNLNGDWVN